MCTSAVTYKLKYMAKWVNSAIHDAGKAMLVCKQPEGILRGNASVHVTAPGHPKIDIEVTEFHADDVYTGNLWMFLRGETPVQENGVTSFLVGTGNANPGILTIETDHGHYQGSKIIWYGGSYNRPPHDIVQPDVTDLIYRAKDSGIPKFYVLPLIGFQADYLPLPELESHPLVLNPSRPEALKIAISGKDAFIQPLQPEEDGIAAVLVSEIPSCPDADPTSVAEQFPFEILSALRFATGSQASSPWLELRDASGQLSARIHMRAGHSLQTEGHSFLEWIHHGKSSGLDAFLTCFMSLEEHLRQWLQVAMNLCVAGTPGSSTVDDNLVPLFRAFELFISKQKHLGKEPLGRVDLRSLLSPIARSGLDVATTEFRKAISAMRKAARADCRTTDDRIFERIESRISNVDKSDSDIGQVLKLLVNRVGLPDLDTLDSIFPVLFGGRGWARVVSDLRQDALHEGYVEFRQKHNISLTFQVLRHLHDLLARLIFITCGYEGSYNPGVGGWKASVPIRWVTPGIEPERLGFEHDAK